VIATVRVRDTLAKSSSVWAVHNYSILLLYGLFLFTSTSHKTKIEYSLNYERKFVRFSVLLTELIPVKEDIVLL